MAKNDTSAPVEASAPAEVAAPVAKAPAVAPELQAAWEAFLAKAEADRMRDGTHEIFLAQKAAGEFNTIPQSFVSGTMIRVAP